MIDTISEARPDSERLPDQNPEWVCALNCQEPTWYFYALDGYTGDGEVAIFVHACGGQEIYSHDGWLQTPNLSLVHDVIYFDRHPEELVADS